MKFTSQRVKSLHSIDGVNYSLDFFLESRVVWLGVVKCHDATPALKFWRGGGGGGSDTFVLSVPALEANKNQHFFVGAHDYFINA